MLQFAASNLILLACFGAAGALLGYLISTWCMNLVGLLRLVWAGVLGLPSVAWAGFMGFTGAAWCALCNVALVATSTPALLASWSRQVVLKVAAVMPAMIAAAAG